MVDLNLDFITFYKKSRQRFGILLEKIREMLVDNWYILNEK